jgi:hypothetical protein
MDVKGDDRPEALGPCPLCGRLMFKGESVDRHHWQPKSQGGKESEYLHRTCRRKLHSLFNDNELATDFASPDKVRQHPEIQKFIHWVRRQPPERVMRHRNPRNQP